jgi:hypothetical protein
MTNSKFELNSWDAVEDYRTREITLSMKCYADVSFSNGRYSVQNKGIENSWKPTESHVEPLGTPDRANYTFTYDKTPAHIFVRDIIQGELPRPEIIYAVADCFNQYFKSNGEVGLEDIFFGKRKISVGNRAARDKRHRVYYLMLSLEDLSKDETTPINYTMTEIANHAMRVESYEKDPETILRNYRRWKTDKKSPFSPI